MGTSTGYRMPKTGPWSSLKNDASEFASEGSNSTNSPEGIVSRFVAAYGGAAKIARAGGIGGARTSSRVATSGPKGGNRGGGRVVGSGREVGRRLGGFLASVDTQGLEQTLQDLGLKDLVGKPASEVAMALLDRLAGPGSTLDEASARMALAKLMEELVGDAVTYEELEDVFEEAADEVKVGKLLRKFFAQYLYEWFCRCFYEDWVKKVGSTKAGRALKSIQDCIEASLADKTYGVDLTKVKWNGSEGSKLAAQIMRETLDIFGVES